MTHTTTISIFNVTARHVRALRPRQSQAAHPAAAHLQRNGFVSRIPAGRTVTYQLTDLGRSLLEILITVYTWTSEHWDELLDARDSDDYG